MNKETIIKELQKNDQTILSFPSRGEWGDNSYRGNCSGYIQAFLMWKYHIKKFAEVFAGSGTGSDVAKDMGVDYIGLDLNPNPKRHDILCRDAFTDDVPDEFYGADMVFMHPPYSELIKIPYAGSMYPDPTGELSKRDLGQMPWDTFMNALNKVIMKFYAAMEKGSYMSVLMGDVRRGGFHSMLQDIVKPGEMQQILINTQHNCTSTIENKAYKSRNFVPIVHEYIMVLKKIMPYMIDFQLPTKHAVDIRDSETATWKDIVYAVMKDKGSLTLNDIYSNIENHNRCEKNPHWKEKIRQTLQKYSIFVSNNRGVWQVAA